jgi:hypothetical protein
MKLKTLKKKIRRLETRLQEGPRKLAKLKRKLEAAVEANAAKARSEAVARAAQPRRPVQASPQAQTKTSRAKPAGEKARGTAKKVKRKLNLSPERRAQLSAAMKARWAAKRAVTKADPQNNS